MADAEDLKYVFLFLEQLNNQQMSSVYAGSGTPVCVGKVGADHNHKVASPDWVFIGYNFGYSPKVLRANLPVVGQFELGQLGQYEL